MGVEYKVEERAVAVLGPPTEVLASLLEKHGIGTFDEAAERVGMVACARLLEQLSEPWAVTQGDLRAIIKLVMEFRKSVGIGHREEIPFRFGQPAPQ